jgi:DNA-directed RNA polymerase specialized sigma24 family protein
MGASNYDKSAQHKRLATQYPLITPPGVAMLLRDYWAISKRRFDGDYAACDILLDLERAIVKANLSNRQRQAVALVYFEGYTQEDAAERLGVSQQRVGMALTIACKRLADVYRSWGYANEKSEGV